MTVETSYAAAVCPLLRRDDKPWDAELSGVLSASGWQLRDDGFVAGDDGAIVSRYELLDVEGATRRFGNRSFWARSPDCVRLGGVQAVLLWSPLAEGDDQNVAFGRVVAFACRGWIVRLADERVLQPVVDRTFSLVELASRYGFDDGDAFLSREPAVLSEERKRLAAAVERAGVEPNIALVATSHNPLRQEVTESQLLKLRAAHVRLWAFDVPAITDESFWLGD